MFDRLVLLAKGKIIYFNKSSESVEYFSKLGFQCPELSNPCDFFMAMMSKESIEFDQEEAGETEGAVIMDADEIEQEYQKLISFFDQKYQASELKNDCD
jgi:ABC-type multidrug transport system ATPase subunit